MATVTPLQLSVLLARIAAGILVVAVAIAVWDGLHGNAVSWRHWLLLGAIFVGVTGTLLPRSRWSLLLSVFSLVLSVLAVSGVIGAILRR